ncbi:MAG: PAS domain S-box protein [Rhodoplanes sp.]
MLDSASVLKTAPREFLRSLRKPVPLRAALALLMIGALLPSLIFFALEYRVAMADKRNEIERHGRSYAQAIADDVTREISVKQAQLSALATSPDLSADNLAGFYTQVRHASLTVPGSIALFNADGDQLFNTLAPFGTTLPRPHNVDVIRKVATTGHCATTDLFKSEMSGRYLVGLVCPTPNKNYVIAGGLPVDHLTDVVRRQTREGWLSALVDGTGTVIARSDRAENFIGTRLPPHAHQRVGAETNGWIDIPLDGVQSCAGWQRLSNNWTVLAAVPLGVVEAPLRRWRNEVLLSLLIFSGLAYVSAALVGEWIIRSMNELSKAAAEIVAGRIGEPSQSSIREVNEVGKALVKAAQDRAKGELANAHLAGLVTFSGDAIMSVSLDGRILSWNSAAEKLYGYRANEAIGRQQSELIPFGRLNEIDEKYAAARAGHSLRLETVRRRKDGTLVEVSLDAGPVRNADGELVGISVIAHDISQRKRNETHMEFVMRELSHRTKNLITVIIAVARRTARQCGDFADFENKFTGRLHGLARSHDLLVHTDWIGASIEELVRSQLAPFITDPACLQTSGPDLLLRPEAVQNLGFALHELATNANKFGALCQAGGLVAIQWDIARNAAGQARIRLTWQERGGPEVEPPTRAGFGSTVIQKLTEASLNATVTIAFNRDGFRWEADMPANEILSEGDVAVSALLAAATTMRVAS